MSTHVLTGDGGEATDGATAHALLRMTNDQV